MESRTFAGIAVDPDLPAEEFGQSLRDRKAQSGAPVMTRRGGIHLLERFEQSTLLVERNANPGIADREMQQPFLGMAQKVSILLLSGVGCSFSFGAGEHFNYHFTMVCKLHRVTDEIDQDLAQPCNVADKDLRNGVID